MATFDDFKTRLVNRAQKIAQSDEFQRAVGWAAEASARFKYNLSEARRAFREQLEAGSEDDLAQLKRELDRLDRQAKKNQESK